MDALLWSLEHPDQFSFQDFHDPVVPRIRSFEKSCVSMSEAVQRRTLLRRRDDGPVVAPSTAS